MNAPDDVENANDPGLPATREDLGFAPPDPADPAPQDRRAPLVFKDNRLLASLPKEERDKLAPHLAHVYLEFKQILYEPNETMDYVYFPVNGVCSMLAVMEDGSKAEVGTVGNEGMIGVPIFLGTNSTPGQSFAQVAGDALKMGAEEFREAVARSGPFRDVIQRYLQALFVQIAQSTACNRLHSTEQRLARWVLATRDRVGADTFTLTQEFMGQMLGVRRATVNEVAGRLQQEGIISYSRGMLTIRDQERLEGISCECYFIIKGEFDRMLNGRGPQ